MFFVNVASCGTAKRVFIDNADNVRGMIDLDYGAYHQEYAEAYNLNGTDNIKDAVVVDDCDKRKKLIIIARKHIATRTNAVSVLLRNIG